MGGRLIAGSLIAQQVDRITDEFLALTKTAPRLHD
jgi:hypothetical protein